METTQTTETTDTQQGLDIRTPIGLMFTILGLLVTGYGLVSSKAIYARSLGINVNLWWGLVLLAFGLLFLWFGRKGTSAMRSAGADAEGSAPPESD